MSNVTFDQLIGSNQLNEITDKLEELKRQCTEQAQSALKSVFHAFFEKHQDVKIIGWRQFTPWFNDGDTCEFNSYASYAWATNVEDEDLLNMSYGGLESESEEHWIDNREYGDSGEVPDAVGKDLVLLRKFLSELDDSVYKDMFGDHVCVIATRSGFDVRDYEHD